MNRILNFQFGIPGLVLMLIGQQAWSFPREMMIQGIKGPWSLTVSDGRQGSGFVFPITVDDEDVSQKIDKVFPVIGTPLQVRILQYCPDLTWNTVLAEDPNGGPAVCVTVAGKGVQQQLYLLADVPERRAMISDIGGLAIRSIYNESGTESILRQVAVEKKIGLLTFWAKADAVPQQFAVKPGDRFAINGTSCVVDVLEYMPHYSIDRDTKQVSNYSDQPRNPALKIRLSDKQYCQDYWLWSNFSMPPHGASKVPMRMEFCDFDPGPSGNRVFIVTSGQSGLWLYAPHKAAADIQTAVIKQPYPFNGTEYTFSLDQVLQHAVLKSLWANKSDRLEHPALIVSVDSGTSAHEKVVEINQLAYVETEYGKLVLSFGQSNRKTADGGSSL